jgi:hypothetical protein
VPSSHVKFCLRPPGWCSGLRHCIAVLAVPLEILGLSPGSVAAGRDQETHGAAHNWPSAIRVREGLAAEISLSHRVLVTPVAGQGQCTLTSSPGVWCFLQHIGAAGFRVGCALCQEAVWLGWVVFRRTNSS